MFSAKTYTARRHELRTKIGSGIILLPGNSLSPNNYPNNAYYFRQDSSFRYYFGLNVPSVVGVIDADTGEEALYGDDFTVEDIIWTGPQPTLREMGAGAGVTATFPMAELEKRLRRAISLGRRVHYLPPYRGETKFQLSALLGIKPALLHDYKSVDLMFAVAEMREKKSAEEVEEMERAFRIGYEMHTTAMRMCRPGVVERQIAGAIEGVAKSQGQGVSFPSIVSQHGETLHNLNADGVLEEGRLLLCDAGGETVEGYLHQLYFTYPQQGGTEALVKALIKRLSPKVKIHTGTEVLSVKKQQDIFIIETTKGSFSSERLVSTMPVNLLAKQYENTPEDIRKTAEELKYNSIVIAVVNVKPDAAKDNFAFMIADKEVKFHRLSKLDFLGRHYHKENSVSYMLEITYRKNDLTDLASDEEITQQIIDGLQKSGFISSQEDVNFTDLKRFEYAYVIYDLNHRRNMDKLKDYFKGEGINLNGRFGSFEYLNMDAVIKQSKQLADNF